MKPVLTKIVAGCCGLIMGATLSTNAQTPALKEHMGQITEEVSKMFSSSTKWHITQAGDTLQVIYPHSVEWTLLTGQGKKHNEPRKMDSLIITISLTELDSSHFLKYKTLNDSLFNRLIKDGNRGGSLYGGLSNQDFRVFADESLGFHHLPYTSYSRGVMIYFYHNQAMPSQVITSEVGIGVIMNAIGQHVLEIENYRY